ncbi:MAG: Gx transporter family protein [Oscillospiraceae bacterium]|nr:Gx transporter family protein [Oscillospiraceae bacterium]
MTFMALLLAVALTIFVAEAQLPPPVPIAGVKLGLANIVTLVALVWLGREEALAILLGRILLGSLFAGQAVSFIYSLAGGLMCFFVMAIILAPLKQERLWVVSVFGAMAHNVGQIIAAALLTHTWQVIAYLPVLIISGILSGVFTGLAAQLVVKRLNKKDQK